MLFSSSLEQCAVSHVRICRWEHSVSESLFGNCDWNHWQVACRRQRGTCACSLRGMYECAWCVRMCAWCVWMWLELWMCACCVWMCLVCMLFCACVCICMCIYVWICTCVCHDACWVLRVCEWVCVVVCMCVRVCVWVWCVRFFVASYFVFFESSSFFVSWNRLEKVAALLLSLVISWLDVVRCLRVCFWLNRGLFLT